MKLQLRYSQHTTAAVNAAVIRGSDATAWLKEISRWKITADQIACYLLPQSIGAVEASGLFVVFKDTSIARRIDLLEPYYSPGEKIFLPLQAVLFPEMSKAELATIFRWPVQVFHPVIGLIGFEKEDAINLGALFYFSEPVQQDWSFAHPGFSPRPPFSQISFISPTAEELMQDIKEEIGQRSFLDIKKDKDGDPSKMDKIIDSIIYYLLKGLFAAASFIGKSLPVSSNNRNASAGKEGILGRIGKWMEQNLEELEKKRKDEINRLLSLFDEDTDEALQYALPLSSPYLNRGSSDPSSRLSRNRLDFNLGKLGGGMRVDSWDVGDRYNELRSKYLKTAQKEIEQKNFKKAAYVYAHLLGDYNTAANVLEQGKMYREAAALHKDHLKNTAAAAECLERGALYSDAIELYKELKRDEKIGDLYRSMQQPGQAAWYYEKHIEAKITHHDYLDGARVMDEKLEAKDRAKETLLQGWNHSYQHEACLRRYFGLVMETEGEAAEEKLHTIFRQHTPKHKRLPFLNVLEYVDRQKKDQAITATIQEIAYQVVNGELEDGNTPAVHELKRFFPNDRLIGSDSSRYSSRSSSSSHSTVPKLAQLDDTIQWIKATWHRNQFLVIGIKNGCLHMARGNWYGNLEYYSWSNAIQPAAQFNFISTPYHSNHIIIHTSNGLPVTRKNLPKNKYFADALTVNCPIWLHNGNAQFIITETEGICKLEIAMGVMTLHYYNIDGEIKRSVNCSFENGPPESSAISYNPYMVSHNGYYYTYQQKQFFAVSEAGAVKTYQLETMIRFFAASHSYSTCWLVISTNKGCLLCKPEGNNINIQNSFFAAELTPSFITFLASGAFVMVEKKAAYLFEIMEDEPKLVQQLTTQSNIIAVLPAAARSKFALLESNGQMTLCERE